MAMLPGRFVVPVMLVALALEGRGQSCRTPLRVMSYNIQAGAGHLDSIGAAIARERPDLVALQEVDVHWSVRSGFADQARELANRLHMDVRFAPIYSLPSDSTGQPMREFGVALLSSFPIVRWSNDTITRLSTQHVNPVPTPMPGLLEATVSVRGRSLQFFTTHLDYRADPTVRRLQVADMLRRIDTTRAVILAGDLNATPDAPELAPLFRVLRDTWPSDSGAGFTYPSTAPAKRIDYVLTSSGFKATRASVTSSQASDHRAVVVDLLLCESNDGDRIRPSASPRPLRQGSFRETDLQQVAGHPSKPRRRRARMGTP